MKRGVFLSGVLLVFLTGCTAMDAIKAVNPLAEDKGIHATAQIGKTNQSDSSKSLIKTDNQTENTFKADKIGKVDQSTNIPWWIAVMVAFMRPMVILKEVKDLFWSKDDESKNT